MNSNASSLRRLRMDKLKPVEPLRSASIDFSVVHTQLVFCCNDKSVDETSKESNNLTNPIFLVCVCQETARTHKFIENFAFHEQDKSNL